MNLRLRSFVVLLAAVPVLAFVSVGSAVQPANPGHQPDHATVVRYWTPERVARAVPREVSPDSGPSGFTPLARNAGKPGGGGGSTTSSGGAQWTRAGVVKETTGKVLFTMAGTDYVCSGSVVIDTSATTSLVLTAGHCAYDETNHDFATHWMFVPDYEDGGSIITNPDGSHKFSCDTVPYGCWTATALVTTTAWANGNGSLAAFNDDYAFAVMGAGGKTGEAKQLDATVGAQGIAFDRKHPATVYAFGYPQASPYDGQKLIYCAGTDSADTWGGTSDFGLKCNMTGGSSGGPWFVDFDPATGIGKLNSVNSFKYTAGPLSKNMFGPYFDAYTQKTYNEALKVPSDNIAIAP